ncbi:BrnA antitoxin family protein [Crenothrix polyspora]|uniref:Uncharacterized protein n=1 Tax=Crenothrix polyspora TaxID=360316 RepID=A0A1R4HII4_9GAMM|nr:BrnA antitoxin family protein [Crenothrix polyspora]SJM96046.1 conserved hypothetical protein [Crenothrix polyspora]
MLLKTKSGRLVELPTDEEEAEINAGIAADPDTYELNDEDFTRMRPAYEVLPEIFGADIAAEMLKPKGGRPRTDTPKVFTGIRLDSDILEAFRATGKGWQTRMNDALKEWLKEHAV